MKSLKTNDCERTNGVNELKRELDKLKELKASFKLKCIVLSYVIICFVAFVASCN